VPKEIKSAVMSAEQRLRTGAGQRALHGKLENRARLQAAKRGVRLYSEKAKAKFLSSSQKGARTISKIGYIKGTSMSSATKVSSARDILEKSKEMRGPLHKLESKIGKLAGKAAKLRGFAFPLVLLASITLLFFQANLTFGPPGAPGSVHLYRTPLPSGTILLF